MSAGQGKDIKKTALHMNPANGTGAPCLTFDEGILTYVKVKAVRNVIKKCNQLSSNHPPSRLLWTAVQTHSSSPKSPTFLCSAHFWLRTQKTKFKQAKQGLPVRDVLK